MRLGSTRVLFTTSMTGSSVARPSNCGNLLSCSGSRCWTSTKAMPVSVGRCLTRRVKASNPPAEAPTPTMGKRFPSDFAELCSRLWSSGAAVRAEFFWPIEVFSRPTFREACEDFLDRLEVFFMANVRFFSGVAEALKDRGCEFQLTVRGGLMKAASL